MIFVDSNVPMYLIGADHPNKPIARRIVERALVDGERLVTDVEVFQEILHRYVAINRRDAIDAAFEVLSGIVSEIFPIDHGDVLRARTLVLTTTRLSARDALHIAVIGRRDVSTVMSFDSGFDDIAGIVRVAA